MNMFQYVESLQETFTTETTVQNVFHLIYDSVQLFLKRVSGIPMVRVWGVQTPLKFRSFDKAEPNSLFCGKYIRNNLIRIWVSLICRLSGTPG
jgi:hypothetical protein